MHSELYKKVKKNKQSAKKIMYVFISSDRDNSKKLISLKQKMFLSSKHRNLIDAAKENSE